MIDQFIDEKVTRHPSRFLRRLFVCFAAMLSAVAVATPLHTEYRNAAYIYGPYANDNGGTQSLMPGTAYLAFPGALLDEMANTTLWAVGAGRQNKDAAMRSYFSHVHYGTNGKALHIIFPVATIELNGGWYKGVIVKLTQGAGGVMAEAIAAKHWNTATGAPSVFDPISGLDNKTGLPSYKSGVNNNTVDNGTTGNYGIRGLMAMTMVPNVGQSFRIFANRQGEKVLTLDDLADFSFDGIMIGGAISTPPNGYVRVGAHNLYRLYDAETGACTNLQFAVQEKNDNYIKCAVVNLTNGVDGVYCHQWCKVYTSGTAGENYQFLLGSWNARGDGFTNGGGGSPYSGYSVAGLRAVWNGGAVVEPAVRKVYEFGIKPLTYGEKTANSPSETIPMITSEPRLAFPGAKLEDLEGDDCIFSGYMPATGANPTITAGAGRSYYKQSYRSGSRLEFIVSTIMKTDGNMVKAVVFKLIQGDDGVYIQGLGARYHDYGSQNAAKANIASAVFSRIEASGSVTMLEKQGRLAETISIRGYGACSIQALKPLTTEDQLAFANGAGESVLTVDDLKDYVFTARPIGNSHSTDDQGLVTCTEIGRQMFVDEDTGKVTNIVFETQVVNDQYYKNCAVYLSNGSGGVNARVLKTGALKKDGHSLGDTILTETLEYKDDLYAASSCSVAPWEGGYGLVFLRAVPRELVDSAIWTGKADVDWMKYQNWHCYNAGADLPGRVPSAASTIRLEGPIANFQVPIGTICPGKEYELGTLCLKADIDWRGIGNAVLAGGTQIDLEGHALDLQFLSGWGTVKTSTAGGVLRLDTPAGAVNEINGVAISTALVKNGEGTLRIVKSGFSLPSVEIAAGTLDVVSDMTAATLVVSGTGAGDGVITVTDTYKPLRVTNQPKVVLANGTKLDLSGLNTALDATKVAYAEGAEIQLKLNGRSVHSCDWLVQWEQLPPEGTVFTCDNERVERNLVIKENGIVVYGGMAIIIR